MLTCTCCDGICGPQTGCNCPPCQKLDAEKAVQKTSKKEKVPHMDTLLNQWAWGPQPCKFVKKLYFATLILLMVLELLLATDQLKLCIQSLNNEQSSLCSEAAYTTLSSTFLYYKLIILKRYFIALNRVPHNIDYEKGVTTQSMRLTGEGVNAKESINEKRQENHDKKVFAYSFL